MPDHDKKLIADSKWTKQIEDLLTICMEYPASVSVLSWDLRDATVVEGSKRNGRVGKFSPSSRTKGVADKWDHHELFVNMCNTGSPQTIGVKTSVKLRVYNYDS